MTESAPGPEPEKENAAALAADTLGRDMLGSLVEELRTIPGWDDLPQPQQERTIGRLGVRVRETIREALSILFGGTYPACVATVDSVQFKDGIKCTLKLGKTEHHRHELADAEGQSVIVVMQAPDTYFARMEEVKARQQQPDLFDPKTAGGYEGRGPRSSTEDGPGLTPVGGDDATAETLTLDMGPLHEQAKGMLEALAARLDPQSIIEYGLTVDDETAAKWSDEDCQRIAAWILSTRKAIAAMPEGWGALVAPCPVLVPQQLELEQAPGSDEVETEPEPLSIDNGPLWQQAQALVAQTGEVVSDELAESWTEEECMEVAHWAKRTIAGSDLPRPDCLPADPTSRYDDDEGDQP